MNSALIQRLREDLDTADYRLDSVRALLGAEAEAARLRGVMLPGVRVLEKRGMNQSMPGALETLVLVFLLGKAASQEALAHALPRLGLEGAIELGLVRASDNGFVAALSLNPIELPDPLRRESNSVEDWLILSDLDDQLRGEAARADHVMGVGGATRSLLAQLPLSDHASIASALDLGTGCGVIALVIARSGVPNVVATDISERALAFARANAQMNGLEKNIDFRLGDLFSPVAGESFDLIASNPPFVITPRTPENDAERYEYRDAGLIGDALAEQVVRLAPNYLRPRGTLVCLANWESPWGISGMDRARGWIQAASADSGELAAWVVERDRLDPVRYAETWARDGGARPGDAEFDRLISAWLEDFSERRIAAVGLGSIRVQRVDGNHVLAGSSRDLIRVEHLAEPYFGNFPGVELSRIFELAQYVTTLGDAELLELRWERDESVVERREHRPGEESPYDITLQTDRPVLRAVRADPLIAAAVGACDGELTLAQIADALATILEVDAGACAEALVTSVRELVWFGMLAPATR